MHAILKINKNGKITLVVDNTTIDLFPPLKKEIIRKFDSIIQPQRAHKTKHKKVHLHECNDFIAASAASRKRSVDVGCPPCPSAASLGIHALYDRLIAFSRVLKTKLLNFKCAFRRPKIPILTIIFEN